MISFGAFYRLAARPAVMLFFVLALITGWGVTTMLGRGFPELDPDPTIIKAIVYSALIGLLAGQLVRELQHSTFTWTLPGVARRTLSGFVAAGSILGLFMAAILTGGAHHVPVVFAVAFTGYCLGSLFGDPLGAAAPFLTIPAALMVVVFSRAVGEQADTRPGAVVAVAGLVCGLCLWRMFSKSVFRRMLFVPTKPTNEFAPAAAERYRREQLVDSGPKRRRWAGTYLGTDLGLWTRAAIYETFGYAGSRQLRRGLGPLIPLVIIVLDAKLEQGGGSFLEALWKTTYHTFTRPPDMPFFGEKGDPHLTIVLVISVAGLMLASSRPVALALGRSYPLSRCQLAGIAYRGYLVTAVGYCLSVAAFCCGMTLAAGYLAGYQLRLDFVPLWLRALLWTLVALPLGQSLHLLSQGEDKRRSSESALARIALVLLIAVGVCFVTLIPAQLLPPSMELAVVAVLVVASQTTFRRWIARFFATADLA